MKKIVKIVIILILVIILTVVIEFIVSKEKQESIEVYSDTSTLNKELTVEFGEKVKVSDFVEKINGTIIDDYEINTEKLGEVKVPFEFINDENEKEKSEFTIKVVDTKSPQTLVGSTYVVEVGFDKNLTDILLSYDDADGNLTREIIGDYDLNTVGSYELTYIVTDSSENRIQNEFTLYVREKSDKTNTKKVYMADVLQNYKTENTKIGIDVSKWEEEIDWQKAKNDGVEFAIIRIGYQTEYDGHYVLDPYFVANIEGAKSVGLPVGIYFYSYAKNEEQAIEQAEWVKENLKGYEIDLPIAFDWESWNSFNTTGMSLHTINKVANVFLDILEEAGYKGMLYSSKTYLEKIWYPTKYEVWLAHYTSKTTYEGKYSIWQMTNCGRVDGISDDVDINIMYLDK